MAEVGDRAADKPTIDPFIMIEKRVGNVTTYRYKDGSRRWTISGVCNRCGECEVGKAGAENLVWLAPVGTPGALGYDPFHGQTLDVPILPEGCNEDWPHCSLTGTWL